MDSKFYVSSEAEELLKEKGCDIEKDAPIYNKYGDVIGCYPADRLTKAEAIDWLESKGKLVESRYDSRPHKAFSQWEYFVYAHDKDGWLEAVVCSWKENNYYNTKLEAEEAAIIKALKLL